MRIDNSQSFDPVGAAAIQQFLYDGFATSAAVAAQSSLVQLMNPTTSIVGLQILAAMVSIATAGDIILSFSPTPLTTQVMLGQSTVFGVGTSQAQVRTSSAAAIPGTQIARLSLPANQSLNVILPWEYVCHKTNSLVVAAVTVNVALTVTFRWLEYIG